MVQRSPITKIRATLIPTTRRTDCPPTRRDTIDRRQDRINRRRTPEYCRRAGRVRQGAARCVRRVATEGTSLLANVLSSPGSRDFLAVADRGGQLVWIEAISKRAAQFDHENGLALRWHPWGRDNIILIDPRIAFDAPVVGDTGIPTYVIRERYKAGEDVWDGVPRPRLTRHGPSLPPSEAPAGWPRSPACPRRGDPPPGTGPPA